MANEQNLRPWKKGQTGNPNGRPPKMLSTFNSILKRSGIERATQNQVAEAYELCLNLNNEKLQRVANNEKLPVLVRIVAKRLLDGKQDVEMVERILDRAHGKARQALEMSGKDGGPIVHTLSGEITFK